MRPRKGLLLGIGTVVGSIVVLVILPLVLPTGRLIPPIERLASEQLQEPVRIESLQVHFLPLPHITIHGLQVGKENLLRIETVRAMPRWSSVLDDPKVIRTISLDGVTVGEKLVSLASQWAARGGNTVPAPVRVERILVSNANIELADFRLRRVDVDLVLTPDGTLERALVVADRGGMRATLVPQEQQFALQLSAREWKLPAGPPLLLTTLEASGTIGPEGLVLPTIEGVLYDGSVSGKLAVGWKGHWTIGGIFEVRRVEIQPVAALLTRDTTISGRLSANPVIDMRAPSVGELAGLINVETDFRIENGVLYKVDLSAAPKALLDKDAVQGGTTRFDEFSGYLRVSQFGYQLSELKISSGVLAAQGHLAISPERALSGRIEAAVKGTASLVSTPLAVSGTVNDPVVRPTAGSIAGAALGTALLGPGFGTAIGLKAAQLSERLFGTRPPKKREAGGNSTAMPQPAATDPATQKRAAQPLSPVPKGTKPTVTEGRR